jgi:undecaprenyl-diphosphatase
MQDILNALLLGVIEGLTEFLPISSTAHLLLSQRLLGFKDTARVFTVVIQLGAICAVLWHLREDIKKRIVGLFAQEDEDMRFVGFVALATLPALLFGAVFDSYVEENTGTLVIGSSLIVGAFFLHWADKRASTYRRSSLDITTISPKKALIIGAAQAVAIIPGVSRSGASIVGGLFVGLDRKAATIFSFYLSLPIIIAASAYKLITDGAAVAQVSGGWGAIIAGFLASAVIGSLVIRYLLWFVARNTFRVFVFYRIALGLLVLGLYFSGRAS